MTNGDYIPDDIIGDILSKLPSRSVWRFKIVCKTWYSLISDPVFTCLHSQRAPKSPKILYSTPGTSRCYQLLDYESSSFDDCCLSGPINYAGDRYIYDRIVGSSCGLVCLSFCGEKFTIWNPLTKEYRIIPELLSMMKTNKSDYFHGLGYDLVANDFKLVISKDRIKYNIFSLKENSWKTITCPIASQYYHPDAIQHPLHWNSLAIILNGIFHWVVVPANNINSEIVAFDAGNETFQKLQLPQRHDVPYIFFHSRPSLLEHRGCLCVSFEKYGLCPPVREIWMMKEYGGWIHLLTIKNPTLFYFRLPVLCISTTNEVVFHTDEKFSRCGRQEEDKLDERFRRIPCTYGAILYVETFVSPNTGNWLQATIPKREEIMNAPQVSVPKIDETNEPQIAVDIMEETNGLQVILDITEETNGLQVTIDITEETKKLIYESIIGWFPFVLVSFILFVLFIFLIGFFSG